MTKEEFIDSYKVSLDSTGLVTTQELAASIGCSQARATCLVKQAIAQGIMRPSAKKKQMTTMNGITTSVHAYEFIEAKKGKR